MSRCARFDRALGADRAGRGVADTRMPEWMHSFDSNPVCIGMTIK